MSPALKDVYARLLALVETLGADVTQAPKKGYVSIRRRKQFAMLQPGSKWVNLGLILPQRSFAGRFESAAKWNALFTHRVRVTTAAEVDDELGSWLRAAYDSAG